MWEPNFFLCSSYLYKSNKSPSWRVWCCLGMQFMATSCHMGSGSYGNCCTWGAMEDGPCLWDCGRNSWLPALDLLSSGHYNHNGNEQADVLSPRSLSSSLSLCLCKICPSNRDKSLEKSNKSQIAIYLRTVTLFITKWKIQGLYTQQQLIISSCHHFTEKRYLSSTLHCQKRRILETIVVRIWVCMWF